MSEPLKAETGELKVPAQKEEPRVWFSLIVPTFNEKDNVELLVRQVSQVLDPNYKGRYEIVFADDNSPDGTAERALAMQAEFPQVKVMVRTQERGLATCVVRGWQQACGEILGVIDGDLQHPPDVLADMLNRIENGADLVLATRYSDEGSVGEWGWLRTFNSQGARALGTIFLPEAIGKVSDPMSGCFVLRRSAIANERLAPRGYKILLEVLARGRFKRVEESAYVFQMRMHGVTKLTWKQYMEYLQQVLELRLFLWSRMLRGK
jgi:dolichol-phosphate mannosyltransferase